MTYIGTVAKSFPQAEAGLSKLLDLPLGRKRIERLTERLGDERAQQADGETAVFRSLTLTAREAGPEGVAAPQCGVVLADGGRYQRNEVNEDAQSDKTTHWFEFKAGVCQTTAGRADGAARSLESPDPCPEVPELLLDLGRIETLAREIGKTAARVAEPAAADANPATDANGRSEPRGADGGSPPTAVLSDSETEFAAWERKIAALLKASPAGDSPAPVGSLPGQPGSAPAPEAPHGGSAGAAVPAAAPAAAVAAAGQPLAWSPKVQTRDVVATCENSESLGWKLAARAWNLGLFQAPFKAFVADGSSGLWGIFNRHFKTAGFVPIVDIIHAVTYVFAAACAGRPPSEATPIYLKWVTWLWHGDIAPLISELAARQAEIGLPAASDSETSPRQIVTKTLTYFQNQQSRMKYGEYRRLGLPITSSHMESAIKELNQRIKGTEKFWAKWGAEAVLQLKADTLCDSDPLKKFWAGRQETRSGLHHSAGSRQPSQPPQPSLAT